MTLKGQQRIVFFTGAGMSAESGVPTYRGKGGVWKEYDYRKYATQYAFDEDPERVWAFHNERRRLLGACEPNEGHRIIARLEQERDHVTVITQNIDGLHQLARTRNIIELHGNLWRSRCMRCGEKMESRQAPLTDLKHAGCDGWWRPDIVWFGDVLSQQNIDAARREMKACDVFVSIGTSAAVYPAAELPLVAKEYGAKLIEINPEPTPLSHAYDECLRGTATAMLRQLVA